MYKNCLVSFFVIYPSQILAVQKMALVIITFLRVWHCSDAHCLPCVIPFVCPKKNDF